MNPRTILSLRAPLLAPAARLFSRKAPSSSSSAWASQQFSASDPNKRILVSQFDLAGTLVDPFCIAPYHAFFELFKKRGFHLSAAQITGPMGLKKIEHIKHLLQELRNAWKEKYGLDPQEQDAEILNQEFNVLLNTSISQYTELTPHSHTSLDFVLRHGLRFAFTSGYARPAADKAMARLALKYNPDASTTSDEVEAGTRIAMLLESNHKLGLNPEHMKRVIFFTDASSDIRNVRSAALHPWIIGVAGYSTHVGVTTLKEAQEMPSSLLQEKRATTRKLLQESGAHCVIEDLSELPLALVAANQLLLQGLEPDQVPTFELACPEPQATKTRGYRSR